MSTRRLPVYIVLDTSGSMSGEPIEAVKQGMQVLVSSLRQDPYALETVYLSVITFSDDAHQVTSLTPLPSFQIPDLSAQGTTALGMALEVLADRLTNEVQKTTVEQKGDWKPMVFLMSDGAATDDLAKGLSAFHQCRVGVVVACAAGPSADTESLMKITQNVVQLDTADSATIKQYFKWVTASVAASHQSVNTTGKEVTGIDQLPPPPPELNLLN